MMETLPTDYDERYAFVAAQVAARKAALAESGSTEMQSKIKAKAELAKHRTDELGDIKKYFSAPNQGKIQQQVRVGGSKGKEGRGDHTAGKKAFKRPCTVGWKSQNQPTKRGGGNRTPL